LIGHVFMPAVLNLAIILLHLSLICIITVRFNISIIRLVRTARRGIFFNLGLLLRHLCLFGWLNYSPSSTSSYGVCGKGKSPTFWLLPSYSLSSLARPCLNFVLVAIVLGPLPLFGRGSFLTGPFLTKIGSQLAMLCLSFEKEGDGSD
jgi:hypothetical protein